MKKLLCTLLCVMLAVTMMPVMAWAEDTQTTEDTGNTETHKEYELEIIYGDSMNNRLADSSSDFKVVLVDKANPNEMVDYQIGANIKVIHNDGCTNRINAVSFFGPPKVAGQKYIFITEKDPAEKVAVIPMNIPEKCCEKCQVVLLLDALLKPEATAEGTESEYTEVVAHADTLINITDALYRINLPDIDFNKQYGLGEIISFKDNVKVEKSTEPHVWEVCTPDKLTVDGLSFDMVYSTNNWAMITEPAIAAEKFDGQEPVESAEYTGIYNIKKLIPGGDKVTLNLKHSDGTVAASEECKIKGFDNISASLNGASDVYINEKNPFLRLEKSNIPNEYGIEFVAGTKYNGIFTPLENQASLFEYIRPENSQSVKGVELKIAEIIKQASFADRKFELTVQTNLIGQNDTKYTASSKIINLKIPDYKLNWHRENGKTPCMFNDQDEKIVYFDKNGPFTVDNELSFKVGQFVNNQFKLLESSSVLCKPYKEIITDEDTNAVTEGNTIGAVLYPEAIAAALGNELTADGEEELRIQPYVLCNGISVPINTTSCWIYTSKESYKYPGDMYMLPGDKKWVNRTVWGEVENAEFPHGRDGDRQITDVISSNSSVVKVTEVKDEGWWIEALGESAEPVTITIKHNGFSVITPDNEETEEDETVYNTKTGSFKAYVVNDIWECDVNPVGRAKNEESGKL